MSVNDMNQLLKHELGDLLYAERTFLRGLKKMSKEVQDPMMNARVVEHATETEEQIRVLEQAFEAIGYKPRAEKCDAAVGLKEEHDSFAEEEAGSPAVLEAFDLGSGLRIEHYEIAAYTTAIAIAKELGNQECVELLGKNLEQERAMAAFLEQNAGMALRKLRPKMEEQS